MKIKLYNVATVLLGSTQIFCSSNNYISLFIPSLKYGKTVINVLRITKASKQAKYPIKKMGED